MGLPARLMDTVRRSTVGRADRLPAVRWLSLPQLVRTAGDVSQASSFAKYADKREAMATCPREFYVLPEPAGEALWVDYVSDTGDGFDATFATARCLSGGADVRVAAFADRPARADLLVFGGDEVYPVASARQYELRLNGVLRLAAQLDGVTDLPPVAALPGNHDWYDGLAAFRRNFCESWVGRPHPRPGSDDEQVVPLPGPGARDDVGGWGAFQSRSYFAVRLTPRWWLWAVDGQLDAPMDAEQLSYFRSASRHLGDAKIVLCTATPSWLEAGVDEGEPSYSATEDTPLYTLLWFVDRVLGEAARSRVRLIVTGDQHHYARYRAAADAEVLPDLITCGGGGAFLASTHHLPERLAIALQPWPTGSGAVADYTLVNRYPTAATSRRLGRSRFLSAAWRNGPSLPLLLGAVDFLLFLAALAHWPFGWAQAWQFWVPLAVVATLLTGYAYTGGATAHPARVRGWPRTLALGLGHTVAHAALAVLVVPALLLGSAGTDWAGLAGLPWIADAVAALLLLLLAPAVFATYLFVADRVGYHTLEAFSGMRIEDYKSHLRLRVTDEAITVHVLGMDAVPRTDGRDDLSAVRPRVRLVESFMVPWDDLAGATREQATAPATDPQPVPASPVPD